MTRVSRSRSKPAKMTGCGDYENSSGYHTCYLSPVARSVETCDDYVGTPFWDSPLDIKKAVGPLVTADGYRPQSGFFRPWERYHHLPFQWQNNNFLLTPWNFQDLWPGYIPLSTLSLMAVENMNPNAPTRDLPVSVAELYELPRLLRDAGRIHMGSLGGKPASKAYIMYEFGVKPLIDDVKALFKFTQLVERREAYLRKLAMPGGLHIKRKLTEESWNASRQLNAPFGIHIGTQGSALFSGKRNYWFTARAQLNGMRGAVDYRTVAWQKAYGLDGQIHLQQLWELIPWSWLVDWFADFGTFLGAARGSLDWEWSDLNLMYRDDLQVRLTLYGGWTTLVTPSSPEFTVTRKQRKQYGGFSPIAFRMPILTTRMHGILAALSAIKAMRY